MSLHYTHNFLCSDIIGHNARYFTNDVAVVCGEQRQTWSELDRRTNKIANAIRELGFDKGDKIAMLMPSNMALFELFWGVVKAGCVTVTLNPLLEGEALVRLCNASDAQAFFADADTQPEIDARRNEFIHIAVDRYFSVTEAVPGWASAEDIFAAAPDIAPDVNIDPDDSMTIIFSSGSTGTPKGIEHSHFGRLNYPLGFGWGLRVDRDSVAICATPLYASGTWITMFPTMYQGGKIVLVPKYSPENVLKVIESEGGTHTFLVPTQYIGILREDLSKYNLSSMKCLVTAGQTLPKLTYEELEAEFPGAKIFEIYGMTEGFSTLAIPGDIRRGKRGSVGKPAFFEDMRIIDENGDEVPPNTIGEIVGYGPGLMKGYYGRPDLTEAAKWIGPKGRTYMKSGDLGYLDEDNYLYIAGRLKDMIKSGGINIFAADIEEVFLKHPAVSEVSVVGVPHEKWTETPIAVVVPNKDQTFDSDVVLKWCNSKLSKYQRVQEIIVQEDFPRALYGKVQKTTLRNIVLKMIEERP